MPQVGAVDVSTVGGPVLVRDLGFARPTGYAAVPAGAWRLRLTSPAALSSLDTVRLRPNSVYTLLVLQPAARSGALRVATLVDAVGSTRMPTAGPDTGYGGMASRTTAASG